MTSKRKNHGFGLIVLGLGAALSLSSLATGCGGETQDPLIGSESHFLTLCDDDCGNGLSCIQGICTDSCLVADEESCSELPGGATCTNESGETGSVAVCDVGCDETKDCSNLGDKYACDGSFCRAPRIREEGAAVLEVTLVRGRDEDENLDCMSEGRLDANGTLPCLTVETIPIEYGYTLDCGVDGRDAVESDARDAIINFLRQEQMCDGSSGFDCRTQQMCEVKQLKDDRREPCLNDEGPASEMSRVGFCALDESAEDLEGNLIAGGVENGVNPLLAHCAAGERAALRPVGENTPSEGTYWLLVCED